MTDRPILFSGPMVRAILDGRKTQTRRVLKPPRKFATTYPVLHGFGTVVDDLLWWWDGVHERVGASARLPYSVGDRLWVRETWAPLDRLTHNDPGTSALAAGGFYKADGGCVDGEISRWTPAIHMPRRASRLTLTVTDVRVERVQDIDELDAKAEGCREQWNEDDQITPYRSARTNFAGLWNSLNARRGYGWDANPWVAAVTFTVERRNDAT